MFSILVGETRAASITVDKSADEDTNGACALWDAITAANTDTATNGCPAGSGADTITLAVNITLADNLPKITSEITIEGANFDIDGNDESQIFYVNGGDLTANNLTLTGGYSGDYGGAIYANGGSVTVTNSRLEDNDASLLGGAISTTKANVIIRNSVFVGNTSGSLGGAVSFHSPNPARSGWTEDMGVTTLLIDQSSFGEGIPDSCDGSGISANPSRNEAANAGGAMRISGGDVTIRRSSFVGNKAGTDGGAIYSNAWRFLFENNTVSCNRADADGGGIYAIVGDLILRHSTIYQNSAGDAGGGLFSIDDSGGYPDSVEVTWGLYLQNSIIAGSTGGGDCMAYDEIDHNLGMYVGDGTCEPACSAQDGPINLGELQGEPAYHPLLDGSIAINRADTEVCSLSESTEDTSSQTVRSQQAKDFEDMNICEELEPEQDQIGTNRPMYGNCDIGSIESRTGAELPDDDLTNQDERVEDTDTPVPTATDTEPAEPPDPPVPPDPVDTDTPTPTATDTEPAEPPIPPDPPDPEPTDTPTPTATDTEPADPLDPEDPITDADATATAFEATEESIRATQTSDHGTYVAEQTATSNAHATETAVAELPPAEQTAIAQTGTAIANLPPVEQTAIAQTGTAVANLPPVEQTAFALTGTAVANLPPAEQTAFALTQSAIDPATRCTHTVEVGDTLFQLALTYNTSVEAFRSINQLTEDALYVGAVLIVPDCYRPGDDIESSSLGFSCQNLYDSMVVRTTSRVVGCREVDIGLIDKHPALASGMIAAIDVFGYVESGVEICFRNIGELVFLDRVTEPPTPKSLSSYNNAVGMTCGEVENVGTLVLVAAVIERDTFVELTSCQVTTTQTVRLRDEVGSSTALRLVPYNVRLDTYSRTKNWFNVTFLGTEGWISARYTRAEGICE